MQNTAQLIEEIKQISIQYQAEVGRGRKAWPKSIKDRVAILFSSGMKAPTISKATGLAYYTILKWRPGTRGAPRGWQIAKFRELEVSQQSSNLATVTEPQKQASVMDLKLITVTVTTPDDFQIKIEGLEEGLEILRRLRGT